MNASIPILMYHEVTPRPLSTFLKYSVTRDAFAAQMNWLARAGYVTIDLDPLLDARAGRAKLPPRPVIITFDDGFRDCIEYAAPIMKAKGFTATFYLVVGYMGKAARWLLSERGIELPIIDWAAARRLEAEGFRCGAHSVSHPHLAEISPATCRQELLDSRRILEDQLGHEVRHLAYPFGSYNETVQAIAAETGYSSACSVRIGLSNLNDDDVLALHRVPVNGQDSLIDFICRLHTARTPRELVRNGWTTLWHKGRLSK